MEINRLSVSESASMAISWSMHVHLYAQIIVGLLVFCLVSCSSEQDMVYQHRTKDYFLEENTVQTGVIKRGIPEWHRSEGPKSYIDTNSSNGESEDNCSSPQHHLPKYNSSCELVRNECRGKVQLLNYLSFVLCDLKSAQPLGYIILVLWLVYLISLLATTVDNFFVPPLTFLADKLKLSPSIAGITLMALGNAAPDIFVVYSGLAQDDVSLVLGSLIGGGIFITTVVLGSVIMITKEKIHTIDKIDFMRDIFALMIVIGIIFAVAFDGVVYLIEALMFPLIYFIYLAGVIGISYVRNWMKKTRRTAAYCSMSEEVFYNEENPSAHYSISLERTLPLKYIAKAIMENDETQQLLETSETNKVELPGLTWPSGAHIIIRLLWIVQWPFSLLRWITIPPFYHNHTWSRWHSLFAIVSPFPMAVLLLVAAQGWSGFTLYVGRLPLLGLLAIIGISISVLLFLVLRSKQPPHWSLQLILVPAAFTMAIVWLNIIANEVVSVLKAFGLLLNIDTGILGLTVLAFGNSVADWVADTVVARCGKPEMAIASCFGSPLMSNVVGLSVALIYSQVKLSWIFLGISLVVSTILFPVFKFSPPRLYGLALILIYSIFVMFAVLGETGVVPVHL